MKKKKFAVLGLGVFGSTLAKRLNNYGYDVIAVDSEISNVEKLANDLENVVSLDFTDLEQLRNAGVGDCDVGIITTGSSLENTIIGTLNLKNLGIKKIIVKVKDKRNSDIMLKIGADETITPERDAASQLAKKLISDSVVELFDLDSRFSIFEMVIKPEWVGKNLIELELRSKYNVNVIGLRRDGKLSTNINPREIFANGDEVLVICDNESFKRLQEE